MKKYQIEVRETLSKLVEVEAETSDEAIDKIKDLYHTQQIILTADDFDGDAEFFDQTIDPEDLPL